MKKLFIAAVLFIFCGTATMAQTALPAFADVTFAGKDDYKKADSIVLQTANYLFATPNNKDNTDRLRAVQFLMKWMEGTPDYTFSINGNVGKNVSNDLDMFAMYLASAVKFDIENPTVTDDKQREIGAYKLMLAYADKPENNLKVGKKLKPIMNAYKKGDLEKALYPQK